MRLSLVYLCVCVCVCLCVNVGCMFERERGEEEGCSGGQGMSKVKGQTGVHTMYNCWLDCFFVVVVVVVVVEWYRQGRWAEIGCG